MLTNAGSRARLARLRRSIDGQWDAAVVHLPEHLLYFANFFPSPNSLNLQSSSFLLVERDGPATLFTDNWLARNAEPAADAVVATEWYASRAPALNRAAVVGGALRDRLKTLRVRRLACEAAHLPWSIASVATEVFDIEFVIRKLREIKDTDEIDAIRVGVRAAEAVHAASRALLHSGLTEVEYYASLVAKAMLAAGGPCVMMCDLISGDRTVRGSGGPTARVMTTGELVILDVFPYVDGYRGDIANTLVVGGRATSEQEELFEQVHAGLTAAELLLQPGTAVRDVFGAIDLHFQAVVGRGLSHHAGHGIGLGHPEAPELVPDSSRTLEPGMVVTLEPGLYEAPLGGIRIEHNYLITHQGYERLSNHRLGLT